MTDQGQIFTILMADDDPDDCVFVKEAFDECQFPCDLYCVEDGDALMDYLHRQGNFMDPLKAPYPDLILLDLNMPKKDGREALREIKASPGLKSIPIVILSTSQEGRDVAFGYETGASAFITKPSTYSDLVDAIRCISKFWFDVVTLPRVKTRVGRALRHKTG